MVELGPVVVLQDEERGEHALELERGLGQLASFVQQQPETKIVGRPKQGVGLLVDLPRCARPAWIFPGLEPLRSSGFSIGLSVLDLRSQLAGRYRRKLLSLAR